MSKYISKAVKNGAISREGVGKHRSAGVAKIHKKELAKHEELPFSLIMDETDGKTSKCGLILVYLRTWLGFAVLHIRKCDMGDRYGIVMVRTSLSEGVALNHWSIQ